MIHPESTRVLGQLWYVCVDDLVGGYIIANSSGPASQLDHTKGEREILECWSKEVAQHVCDLHNENIEIHGDEEIAPTMPNWVDPV